MGTVDIVCLCGISFKLDLNFGYQSTVTEDLFQFQFVWRIYLFNIVIEEYKATWTCAVLSYSKQETV